MSITDNLSPSVSPGDLDVAIATDAPTITPESLDKVAVEGPTMQPPGEGTAVQADEVSAAQWVNTKVTAMYGHGPARVSYAALDGHGWCRIGGNAAGGKVSLTMMLSMAEQTGANCRILLDNKVIKTAYVF